MGMGVIVRGGGGDGLVWMGVSLSVVRGQSLDACRRCQQAQADRQASCIRSDDWTGEVYFPDWPE